MEVIITKKDEEIKYHKDVKPGELFRFKNWRETKFFIRVIDRMELNSKYTWSVQLDTGELVGMYPNQQVEILEGVLNIKN